jgi:hypothetical protein
MEVHPTKMDWNDPREVELVGEDVVNMFKEVIRQICGVGVGMSHCYSLRDIPAYSQNSHRPL